MFDFYFHKSNQIMDNSEMMTECHIPMTIAGKNYRVFADKVRKNHLA